MKTGTNYVILTAPLRIEKQMWLMFCLYVLFIWHMPQFNITLRDKHETRSTENNIIEITRSRQQTELTIEPLWFLLEHTFAEDRYGYQWVIAEFTRYSLSYAQNSKSHVITK